MGLQPLGCQKQRPPGLHFSKPDGLKTREMMSNYNSGNMWAGIFLPGGFLAQGADGQLPQRFVRNNFNFVGLVGHFHGHGAEHFVQFLSMSRHTVAVESVSRDLQQHFDKTIAAESVVLLQVSATIFFNALHAVEALLVIAVGQRIQNLNNQNGNVHASFIL